MLGSQNSGLHSPLTLFYVFAWVPCEFMCVISMQEAGGQKRFEIPYNWVIGDYKPSDVGTGN